MSWRRWILGGWIALLVIAAGLAIGYLLYTRIVVGISLTDQPAKLLLPKQLLVRAEATQKAAITLQGDLDVAVPFKNDGLELPLYGDYSSMLSLDTEVPLRMTIDYQAEIPVKTEIDLEGDSGIVYKWLPHLPLRGKIPLELKVPVNFSIPVDTKIRFKYEGPVDIAFHQTLRPPVNTVLHTRLTLNKDIDAPITSKMDAMLYPHDRSLDVKLINTELSLPLEDLKLTTSSPNSESN